MKTINKINKIDVVKFFETNKTKSFSKTEISKYFGFKEISEVVKRIINELLRDRVIGNEKKSGVEKYFYNNYCVDEEKEKTEENKITQKESSSVADNNDIGGVVSEKVKDSDLDLPVGYELFREENNFIINTPNKENIVIDKDERLIVVNNGEKLYKIKNKVNLFMEVIRKYSIERGIKTYTISSPKIGYFVHIDDFNKIVDDVIIFLNIKQEDKAN